MPQEFSSHTPTKSVSSLCGESTSSLDIFTSIHTTGLNVPTLSFREIDKQLAVNSEQKPANINVSDNRVEKRPSFKEQKQDAANAPILPCNATARMIDSQSSNGKGHSNPTQKKSSPRIQRFYPNASVVSGFSRGVSPLPHTNFDPCNFN